MEWHYIERIRRYGLVSVGVALLEDVSLRVGFEIFKSPSQFQWVAVPSVHRSECRTVNYPICLCVIMLPVAKDNGPSL